jgi:flagellar biosynthesis protein FlhG
MKFNEGKFLAITSGKGGVGKTFTAINFAIELSRMKKKVLLVDADFGLANIPIMLSLQEHYSLEDFLEGDRKLSEILVEGPEGILILPGANGVETLAQLTASKRLYFFGALQELSQDFDYVLIDTQAGITEDVLFFCRAADEVLVVVNPESTSITDSYAIIKLLLNNSQAHHINIIVNNTRTIPFNEATRVFEVLESSTATYLKSSLQYLGNIPADPLVEESIRKRNAITELFPGSRASRSIKLLVKQFLLRRKNLETVKSDNVVSNL